VAKAVVENPGVTLNQDDVESLLSPKVDDRDFTSRTFGGLCFPDDDHAFLDAAWSHIDTLPVYKRELAISALCLAAARKQPRGVFTITDVRYDDGRRQMRMPLRDLSVEAVGGYNQAVFDNGGVNRAMCTDILQVDPSGYDLVYFDPPYAPPSDDADYLKRYHFLEGLSVYWRGLKIMQDTKTKKVEKRFTPFAYKNRVRHALRELFHRFRKSTIVRSYSSNSVPDEKELFRLLRGEKQNVEVYAMPYKYSFGTHEAAQRRDVHEYIFVAR
jgi:adenine-specific DNA-methyltransferase